MKRKQTEFLKKYSKLSQNSQEWSRIEYLLQISLGACSARISNIWSIASGHISYNFEKNNEGVLILDSWLETKRLDENNSLEKICQLGFQFPKQGLCFSSGQIQLDDKIFNKNKTYEFLLLKIAVGKSFCVPKDSYLNGQIIKPYGFDSIYLIPTNNQDESNNQFGYDYILDDNSQILPNYVIHFEIDPDKEQQLAPVMCEICKETKASVYCNADQMCLCFDCDEEHHNQGGKLVSRHQRVPMVEKPKAFGNCNWHPGNQLELYCNICHIPLCVYCKINGSHSMGEAQAHTVVKISDAYSKVLEESREVDPYLDKRKIQLSDMLQDVDIKIKEIKTNAQQIEDKIYKTLQKLLKQLQEETQKKMTFLIGNQIEIKRQFDYIQWLEEFLKYQQLVLAPSEYLNSWSKHIILRNEILSFSYLPLITNVMPDLELEGNLRVVCENIQTQSEIKKQNQNEKTLSNSFLIEQSLQAGQLQTQQQLATSAFKQNIFSKNQYIVDNNQQSSQQNIQQMNIQFGSNQSDLSPMIFAFDSTSPGGSSPTKLKQQFRKIKSVEEGFSLSDQQKNIMKKGRITQDANILHEQPDEDEISEKSLSQNVIDKQLEIYDQIKNQLTISDIYKTVVDLMKKKNKENIFNTKCNDSFQGSMILDQLDERRYLYACIPYFLLGSSFSYTTKKIFSAPGNFKDYELETFNNMQFPQFFIIKFRNEKFGGFSSLPFDLKNSGNYGDMNCFLFSLSKNTKILPKKEIALKDKNFLTVQKLLDKKTIFGFGSKDLIFLNDFKQFQTQLENSYTLKQKDSYFDPFSYLTGTTSQDGIFNLQQLEVWAIIQNAAIDIKENIK